MRFSKEVGRVSLSRQPHCFVEAGGCVRGVLGGSGKAREKEREDMVKGEGECEEDEEGKVRLQM